jgi:hypothetical protein
MMLCCITKSKSSSTVWHQGALNSRFNSFLAQAVSARETFTEQYLRCSQVCHFGMQRNKCVVPRFVFFARRPDRFGIKGHVSRLSIGVRSFSRLSVVLPWICMSIL